ncbi:MAG TPA: hypothetical protein VHA14_18165 [Bryobacteraceae bacterium]|nr:hypothetical protein [Bryobacteraceae bacterium]
MIVLADSSPLIALCQVQQVSLLRKFYGEIIISREVYEEIAVAGDGLPGADEIRNSAWIRVASAPSPPAEVQAACAGLGPGERSLIWLAWSLKADLLLIDEWRARRVAKGIGLTIAGSVAILEQGARLGYIADLTLLYADLLRKGIYYNPRLLNESLERLGLPGLRMEP